MRRKFSPITMTEQELMDLLWKIEKPMTSVEILEHFEEKNWTLSYVTKLTRSLLAKGYLQVVGTKLYGTQHARQFVPTLSKQEFYAKFVVSKGINKKDISKIAVAIAKENDNDGNNSELVSELEQLIEKLKEKEE